MPRIIQKAAARGSQKWLQRCMQANDAAASSAVAEQLGVPASSVE